MQKFQLLRGWLLGRHRSLQELRCGLMLLQLNFGGHGSESLLKLRFGLQLMDLKFWCHGSLQKSIIQLRCRLTLLNLMFRCHRSLQELRRRWLLQQQVRRGWLPHEMGDRGLRHHGVRDAVTTQRVTVQSICGDCEQRQISLLRGLWSKIRILSTRRWGLSR